MPAITAFYAGLLGLLSIAIAVAVGRVRGKANVSVGDGSNLEVIAAMRRHANFVEFVPMTLILIALLELNGVGNAAIHGLGSVLLVARLSHAFGYRADESRNAFRAIGAAGSTLALLVASVWSIIIFL
ncbi:MAG: MAPEG family protein [Myxococcales bacterium]|nr:hypothetical protein [Myxococcales bacterium]HIK86349.1 hypothetical protein [Myxococcales bacterium]